MTFVEEFEEYIPSDTLAGQQIQDRIIKVLESVKFPARGVFGVRLALEEALVNAIKHGNGMDPQKNVRVKCQVSYEHVRVEIEDEGKGFCLENVPDPTVDENLEKPCGRGIMLMKAFLDIVEYNSAGTRVLLEKRRNDDSNAAEGDD
jgi:serine/threonine-protein kinase RsbW